MPSQRLSDALAIACGAVLCLVVSLGVYSSSTTGVQDNDFGFTVRHYVMGLPGWLELNVARADTSSSLNEYSRAFARAAEIPLGWHVRPVACAASVGACVLLSAIVFFLNRACCGRARKKHFGRLAWGVAIVVIPALVLGSFVPTTPEWIGACLVLGALPLCVAIASAIMRDYLRAVVLGFSAAVAIIWSQRITDVFGVPDGIQAPPITDDLLPALVFGSYFAAVGLLATFATIFLQSKTRQAEQSLAAESR